VLLAGIDADGNIYVVDEHAERYWIPQRHAQAIKAKRAADEFLQNSFFRSFLLPIYMSYTYTHGHEC
jgi:hypothetical protein